MAERALDQLHELREKRKEQALARLTAQQRIAQQTEAELAEARRAISAHSRTAQEEERRAYARMIGKTLSYSDIQNLQSELGAKTDKLNALRGIERSAVSQYSAAQAKLREAGDKYRKALRRVEKLQKLMELEKRVRRRKLETAAEAGDEDYRLQRKFSAWDGD